MVVLSQFFWLHFFFFWSLLDAICCFGLFVCVCFFFNYYYLLKNLVVLIHFRQHMYRPSNMADKFSDARLC